MYQIKKEGQVKQTIESLKLYGLEGMKIINRINKIPARQQALLMVRTGKDLKALRKIYASELKKKNTTKESLQVDIADLQAKIPNLSTNEERAIVQEQLNHAQNHLKLLDLESVIKDVEAQLNSELLTDERKNSLNAQVISLKSESEKLAATIAENSMDIESIELGLKIVSNNTEEAQQLEDQILNDKIEAFSLICKYFNIEDTQLEVQEIENLITAVIKANPTKGSFA